MTTPTSSTPPTGGSPLQTLLDGAKAAVSQARQQVAANRPKIEAAVDKLGQTVDARTGGKYHKHVETAKQWADKGVDAVTGQTTPSSNAAQPSPGAPSMGAPGTPTTTASRTTTGTPSTAAPSGTSTPVTPATSPVPGTAPATPGTPAPASPTPSPTAEKPKEGWHRGPDGSWVRS